MGWLLAKIKSFFYWLWRECKDLGTLALLGVVIVVMYSPVWGGYLVHFLFGWKWGSVMATAVALFWAGPMTPFFPLCVAITLAIKKLIHREK